MWVIVSRPQRGIVQTDGHSGGGIGTVMVNDLGAALAVRGVFEIPPYETPLENPRSINKRSSWPGTVDRTLTAHYAGYRVVQSRGGITADQSAGRCA
jgi:hypothetical protein